MNRLVMDYLVIEGFKSAAETFSVEANIPPTVDLNSIESRMSIREALQRGDIEDAIARVNDLNPEVSELVLISFICVERQLKPRRQDIGYRPCFILSFATTAFN